MSRNGSGFLRDQNIGSASIVLIMMIMMAAQITMTVQGFSAMFGHSENSEGLP
jgi:hypothetical protein